MLFLFPSIPPVPKSLGDIWAIQSIGWVKFFVENEPLLELFKFNKELFHTNLDREPTKICVWVPTNLIWIIEFLSLVGKSYARVNLYEIRIRHTVQYSEHHNTKTNSKLSVAIPFKICLNNQYLNLISLNFKFESTLMRKSLRHRIYLKYNLLY